MRSHPISSEFAMMVGTAITFIASLLLLICLPVTYADKPAAQVDSDRLTSEYVRNLDQQQRSLLLESLSKSLNRSSSRDNRDSWAAVPDHQIYHAVFLEILINPLLSASLPVQDLELIRALPAHSNQRFVSIAQDSMEGACRIIKRSNTASAAAVNLAANRIRQAQRQVTRELDRHYREQLIKLTDTGKALVGSEYDKLVEQDNLVYTELDLEALGFTQPEFVFAFLQDSCANAERLLPVLATDQHTLQDQLENDYLKGAVQLFQHQ